MVKQWKENDEIPNLDWIRTLYKLQRENPDFQSCINEIIVFLEANSSSPSENFMISHKKDRRTF